MISSTAPVRPRRVPWLTLLVQGAGALSLGLQALFITEWTLAAGASLPLEDSVFGTARVLATLPGVVMGAFFGFVLLALLGAARRCVSWKEPTTGALLALFLGGTAELVLFALALLVTTSGPAPSEIVRELVLTLLIPLVGLVGIAWTVVVEARRFVTGARR